jgi:hypothetical protein
VKRLRIEVAPNSDGQRVLYFVATDKESGDRVSGVLVESEVQELQGLLHTGTRQSVVFEYPTGS